MHDRAQLGRAGEQRVARWYERNGYRVVAQNWRGKNGEIDLVVFDGKVLVIVEVKTRRTDRFGTGAEAVTLAKQQRLRRLAGEFAAVQRASASALRWSRMRIDVAVVVGADVRVLQSAC